MFPTRRSTPSRRSRSHASWRAGQEPVVVNLDLADVEPNPQQVQWVDDIHSAP
jgi:hypothetical protein